MKKLVYLMSLRNAVADCAGQWIVYKGEQRYMKSPLEYLVEHLNQSQLGKHYSLEAVIYDDDMENTRDREKTQTYNLSTQAERQWFYPAHLTVQGRRVDSLLQNIPSSYRALALSDSGRQQAKDDFENRLSQRLLALGADWVVVDGLILILDKLVRPESAFHNRIINIHPGITRADSPFVRRGATATLDALYGARGKRIIDWQTMQSEAVAPILLTGASFHYVDTGIDSGPVFWDMLATEIEPDDTILELRWRNFQQSVFPTLSHGLAYLSALP